MTAVKCSSSTQSKALMPRTAFPRPHLFLLLLLSRCHTLNGAEMIQASSVAPVFSCPLLNIPHPTLRKGNPRWHKSLAKLIRDTLINYSIRHKATTPTVTLLLFSPSVRPKREFLTNIRPLRTLLSRFKNVPPGLTGVVTPFPEAGLKADGGLSCRIIH